MAARGKFPSLPDDIGGFTIIEQIGKGGFSKVYCAQHRCTKEKVAIKIIPTKSNRYRELQEREIELLEELKDHANILKLIVDPCRDAEDNLYIVTELCEKGDLCSEIKRLREKNKNVPEFIAWRWFVQISQAVWFMHEKNIMHRDLKCANIFVNDRSIVKVGDFGLGRLCDDQEYTLRAGTVAFMSPEVFGTRNYDKQIDIWNLGVILHNILKDFDQESDLLARRQVEHGNLPKEYSLAIRSLCCRLLSIDKTKRPTARQLLQNSFIRNVMELVMENEWETGRDLSIELKKTLSTVPLSRDLRDAEQLLGKNPPNKLRDLCIVYRQFKDQTPENKLEMPSDEDEEEAPTFEEEDEPSAGSLTFGSSGVDSTTSQAEYEITIHTNKGYSIDTSTHVTIEIFGEGRVSTEEKQMQFTPTYSKKVRDNSSWSSNYKMLDVGDNIRKIRLCFNPDNASKSWEIRQLEIQKINRNDSKNFVGARYVFFGPRILAAYKWPFDTTCELVPDPLGLADRDTSVTRIYKVKVTTAKGYKDAGTESPVLVNIVGSEGDTGLRRLCKGAKTKFREGQTEKFLLYAVSVGTLRHVVVEHRSTGSWRLEYIWVTECTEARDGQPGPACREPVLFPCSEWLSQHSGDGCTVRTLFPQDVRR